MDRKVEREDRAQYSGNALLVPDTSGLGRVFYSLSDLQTACVVRYMLR